MKHKFCFEEWLNRWGDLDLHQESKSMDKKLNDFAKGYKEAIRDVISKLQIKFEGDNWIKQNFIQLAKEHKERCNNPACNISLLSLGIALHRLSLKPLTKKEIEIFS